MNPLELTKEIANFIIAGKKARSEKAGEYLQAVCSACRELTETENVDSDLATLAHERLKRIYNDASKSFPNDYDAYGSFVLFNALSSARVYYWIRRWESASDANLELAAAACFREDLYESSSPDTLAAEVQRFLGGQSADAKRYRETLKVIKRHCLGDIGQLESFILEFNAR
ncbi:hypothetical protein G8764_06355 [Pseudomaricurvus alcaniphilus]|uniref:hypothetical protein n=1 Tax=Pseudomaricurvus alcaniphilus TaxID=1166482 RepID=UPI00140A6E4E|nr:hypothetical protein [Pseudomaricurvus alcaniphilus]NHN36908.1 hypothetical protein [Pseudomaricurvus alcaniphilus]